MEENTKAIVTVNGRSYEAGLLVFDKDGLMFDSEQFWIELANARMRELEKLCPEADILAWAKLMGVRLGTGNGTVTAAAVDPMGILGVASPAEEMTVLAGFLSLKLSLVWSEARQTARDLFASSDLNIDLKRALKPQPGFTELMRRIADLDIPYGVATSDNYQRTRDSMALFGCWDKVRFVVTPDDVERGKPEPDMLQLISETQKVPPESIVMIGDSYVDVKMAKAAGSVGIGITRSPEMRLKMLPYASEIAPSLEMISIDRA